MSVFGHKATRCTRFWPLPSKIRIVGGSLPFLGTLDDWAASLGSGASPRHASVLRLCPERLKQPYCLLAQFVVVAAHGGFGFKAHIRASGVLQCNIFLPIVLASHFSFFLSGL